MSYMTCEILEGTEKDFQPQMALILYGTESDDGNDSYYVEAHRIRHGKMGAGSPISKECISDIASSFSCEHSITPFGKIPRNLLYVDDRLGHQKYIWYNPPQKRYIFFASSLSIPSAEYHIPGILYVASAEKLNIYAFKGQKPEDKLFKAPFFNTTDGAVCLGSAKIEYPNNPSYADIIDYWEKMFWLTEFTHLGGSSNPTKHNLVNVTKQSKENFDYSELIEMKITLKNLLK